MDIFRLYTKMTESPMYMHTTTVMNGKESSSFPAPVHNPRAHFLEWNAFSITQSRRQRRGAERLLPVTAGRRRRTEAPALGRAVLAAALLALGRRAADVSPLLCGKRQGGPASPSAWGLCLPLTQPRDGASAGICSLDWGVPRAVLGRADARKGPLKSLPRKSP